MASSANIADNATRARPQLSALLIDISGTILIGPTTTPGAAEALARLRAAHIPFLFCSNTSKESTAEICQKMRGASMEVSQDEIWTSLRAVKDVLKEKGIRNPYMLLSPSAQRECVDFSIDTSAAKPQATGVYDGVVVGLAPSLLDYEHLNAAFRILIGEYDKQKSTLARTPLLIALHKAKYLQGTDHALSLGPGPFVSALEEATSTRALIVGKPTKLFFETVISGFGDKIAEKDSGGIGDRQRCVIAIIGDDISTDLGEGAIELGLWRVLVKTGKYRSGDEVRKGVHPPDEICQSFAEFVDQLLSASTSSRVGKEMNTA